MLRVIISLSSLRAFSVMKTCYLQVTVAKPVALDPHQYTKPPLSERICVVQPLENFHAILNVELRSENACKPHLPHPGFRPIGEVFLLIPVYKTPASLIAMTNTL